MTNHFPIDSDLVESRRASLRTSAESRSENSALLNFIICRLSRGKMKLKNVLELGGKQGYTPTTTRQILQQLAGARLIDYVHVDPAVFVQLNEDGYQFAAEVLTHE